jgi:PAS domain S-box-containing protein
VGARREPVLVNRRRTGRETTRGSDLSKLIPPSFPFDGGQREGDLAESYGSFSPRIIDSLLNVVVIIDDQGRILYANTATERLLGWDVATLFGRLFVDLVPERFQLAYSGAFNHLLQSDPPRASYAPSRVVMQRADGSETPVDIGAFMVVPPVGARLLVAVLWDASDKIDIDRYQRISDELLAFLAGASGSAEVIVPQLLSIVALGMDFEVATAWRWDEESEQLHCEHVWSQDDGCQTMVAASTGMTVRAGEDVAGLVVRSDQPVWQLDLSTTARFRRHDAFVADGLHTAFVFPIRSKERFFGVIELFTKFHRHPDSPLNAAVADVGAKLGEFIDRVELEAEKSELIVRLEHSQRRQEFLLRANAALAGARNFQDSVERLATVALPTLGDICLIDVVSPAGLLERLAAVHADSAHQAETDELKSYSPDPDGSHPAARAVRTQRSQWSAEMGDDFMQSTTQSAQHLTLTRTLSFESYVSVPLLTQGKAIGALTVIAAGSGRQFGEEELALAESLASQVTSVIEKARVLEQQSTISHLLQHSLLPDQLGQLPGVRVAARYVAASKVAEVGGDFYDAVIVDSHRLALVIGDVQGHDMAAAMVMGGLRSALRSYLLISDDPAEILRMADNYAIAQATGRLATTCLAIIDAQKRTIELASAGHPLPYLATGDGSVRPLPVRPGRPLGIGGGDYFLERHALPEIGSLTFFTDGLIDEGRLGVDDRISTLTTLVGRAPADPETVADAILSALASSTPGKDDLALLIARWSFPPHDRPSREE